MSTTIDAIAAWSNLESALSIALRQGARQKPGARAFLEDRERNLADIGRRITQGLGPLGEFTEFTIRDPKPRSIVAPCFADRVFHHAVFLVIGPTFEQALLPASCACRKGLGLRAALDIACTATRKSPWFLKLDVRHYFETLPRPALRKSFSILEFDSQVVRLLGTLVEAWRPGEPAGLPIGCLSSQFFANHYLRPMDESLHQSADGYVRYMDDMVAWFQDRLAAKKAAARARATAQELGLFLKGPIIQPCEKGLPFLGILIQPDKATYLAATRARRKRCQLSLWHQDPARAQRARDALDGRSSFLRALLASHEMNFDEPAGQNGRANRGGSWNNTAENCRSGNRNWNDPGIRNNNLGFRPAAAPSMGTRFPDGTRQACRTPQSPSAANFSTTNATHNEKCGIKPPSGSYDSAAAPCERVPQDEPECGLTAVDGIARHPQ